LIPGNIFIIEWVVALLTAVKSGKVLLYVVMIYLPYSYYID
jgi:hypothetical protein